MSLRFAVLELDTIDASGDTHMDVQGADLRKARAGPHASIVMHRLNMHCFEM